MMVTVRIYPSEAQAREAASRLDQAGFDDVAIFTSTADEADMLVRRAVREGRLPGSYTGVCIRSLQQGRAVVAVPTPYGAGQLAIDVLESCGAVDSDALPPYLTRNPAPLSDFLGIPVLAKFSSMTDLSIIPYTFGAPKLSRNAAPLSSLFGLKTLSASKTKRTSSFGLPLLSRNPAPLSSLFRIKTLTSSGSKRKSSFGLPLLSKNPTPLSSLFGLRVLSKRRTKQDRD